MSKEKNEAKNEAFGSLDQWLKLALGGIALCYLAFMLGLGARYGWGWLG